MPLLRAGGPCQYLPDRDCRYLVVTSMIPVGQALALAPGSARLAGDDTLEEMLARGFFRQGFEFWRYSCESCQQCIPMRIPVNRFRPSRSQRRSWRRNHDTVVTIGAPELTEEKYDLIQRHRAKFAYTRDFPWDSCVMMWMQLGEEAREFLYYRGGRLVGLGLVDPTPHVAASLEFWHEVDPRRSLGTFSLMYEIEWCRQTGREYLYLGPWVEGSETMGYKANFRPHELLAPGAGWRWYDPSESAAAPSESSAGSDGHLPSGS